MSSQINLPTPFVYGQRILVVDDDPDVRSILSQHLQVQGFEVTTARTGAEGLEVCEREGWPHLAIVDIVMPRMTGIEFCQTVQESSDLPCILLTGVADLVTIVDSIDRFAEDYITKPFSLEEVTARVRRVLRRMPDFAHVSGPTIYIDENLTIDLFHRQATKGTDTLKLTPLETKILYILLGHADRTVTTDYLLRRIWPEGDVFEDTLRVHISR